MASANRNVPRRVLVSRLNDGWLVHAIWTRTQPRIYLPVNSKLLAEQTQKAFSLGNYDKAYRIACGY